MRKSNFRVFIPTAIICLIIFIIFISFGIIFLILEGRDIDIRAFWSITISLIILPALVLLGTSIHLWTVIGFNEKGLTKSLFGIKLKEFSWDEVKDIKIIPTAGVSWIIFSKVDLKNHGISYCRIHPKTICLGIETEKKLEDIQYWIPKEKKIRYKIEA